MIDKEQAINYSDSLHPSLAGYLHDGTISNRDSLASIFYLIEKGFISANYEQNNVLNPVISFTRIKTNKDDSFNSKLTDFIFGNQMEINVKHVKTLIKTDSIKRFIIDNYQLAQKEIFTKNELTFNVKNTKMKITINDKEINTPELLIKNEKTIKYVMIPAFFIISLMMFTTLMLMYTRTGQLNSALLINFVLFISFSIMLPIGLRNAKHNKKLDPSYIQLDKKYADLYEFLKHFDLNHRKMNLEFLSYAIAFGLNSTFDDEFGIPHEATIRYTNSQ